MEKIVINPEIEQYKNTISKLRNDIVELERVIQTLKKQLENMRESVLRF